jgi:hypothetical protein
MFSKFGGGTNLSVDPAKQRVDESIDTLSLNDNEVWDGQNFILDDSGMYVRPGSLGKPGFNITGNIQGARFFTDVSGNRVLIVVAGGKVYSVNTTTGVATELIDTGGLQDRASFAESHSRLYIACGGSFVKVEGATVAYKVGIEVPAVAPTTAVVAGGSLAIGTWKVYCGYAREILSLNVLYGIPNACADVTLTAGNQTIRISSFANSADAQVTNKVVFMIAPSGTVAYLYYQTHNNTATTFDITTDTHDVTQILDVVAAQNNTRHNVQGVFFFGKKLFCSYGKTLYWSIKSDLNPFDHERFLNDAFRLFPFNISFRGIFGLGENQYVNTSNGIFKCPYGEPNYEYEQVTQDEYWYEMDTVKEYGGILLGVTNLGLKYFDGSKFFSYDFSIPVRREFNNIYNNSGSIKPCAYIYSRSHEMNFIDSSISRTEYHLSYNNSKNGLVRNQKRLVLNLDRIQMLPNHQVIAPWEIWTNGFDHVAMNTNTPYFFQKDSSAPVMYTEYPETATDDLIYNDSEAKVAAYKFQCFSNLRALYSGATAIYQAKNIGFRYNTIAEFQVYVIAFDKIGVSQSVEALESGTMSFWDLAEYDVDLWSSEMPGFKLFPLQHIINGRMPYIQVRYGGGENSFFITDIELYMNLIRTRYTCAR